MKKLILSIMLLLAVGMVASAQTVEIEQTTADRCAACFVQSKAQTDLIAAQDASIRALKAEIAAGESLAAARLTIIDLLRDENDVLRKLKCEKSSFFFGLVSIKKCF